MNRAERRQLEKLACDRLSATADDDEQWSFLFRTDGAESYLYCPWSLVEDREFDGDVEGLSLPWANTRTKLLQQGNAQPTKKELHQWRQAICRNLAAGSDSCWIAWIVPLWVDRTIAGYALFAGASYATPDEPPCLEGIFTSVEKALALLKRQGAIHREANSVSKEPPVNRKPKKSGPRRSVMRQ